MFLANIFFCFSAYGTGPGVSKPQFQTGFEQILQSADIFGVAFLHQDRRHKVTNRLLREDHAFLSGLLDIMFIARHVEVPLAGQLYLRYEHFAAGVVRNDFHAVLAPEGFNHLLDWWADAGTTVEQKFLRLGIRFFGFLGFAAAKQYANGNN